MVQQKDMSESYSRLAQGVFNPLNAQANALALKKAGQEIELNQRALDAAPEDERISKARFEIEQNAAEFSKRLSAMNAALKADTPEKARSIYDSLLPGSEDKPDFSFVGDDVSISYASGVTISGPKWAISEAADQIAKDPTWLTDPEKAAHTRAWMAARGVTMQGPGTVDPNVQAQIDARAAESQKDREFRSGESQKDRDFKASQAEKDRAFKMDNLEDKVPAKVKSAQDLIKSLRGRTSGSTSSELAMLLAAMNNKEFDAEKAKSLESNIPADLRPMYKSAVRILEDYYTGGKKTGTYNPKTGKIEWD